MFEKSYNIHTREYAFCFFRYLGDLQKSWSGVGNVIKVPDNFGDEVGLIAIILPGKTPVA